jgi:hypothetical protein
MRQTTRCSVVSKSLEAARKMRKFIDVRDAAGIIGDEEGGQFEHLEDVLEDAKASARDLVRQYLDNQIPLSAAHVEVRDAQGRTVVPLIVAGLPERPNYPKFKSDCGDLPRPGHR